MKAGKNDGNKSSVVNFVFPGPDHDSLLPVDVLAVCRNGQQQFQRHSQQHL